MRSKDILKKALEKYDGTLIVVSHDRDFLDGLVSKVYEFRHNRIKENIGGIYDFLRKKKIVSLKDIEMRERPAKKEVKENNVQNKQKYLEKKEYERNLRKLRKKLEDSENEIKKLEKQLTDLEKELAVTFDPETTSGIYLKYEEMKKNLNEEMNRWTGHSHEVDEFLNSND